VRVDSEINIVVLVISAFTPLVGSQEEHPLLNKLNDEVLALLSV